MPASRTPSWKRLAIVGFVAVYSSHAFAEVRELDLGPRATNGAAAVAGTRFREVAVVHALACHDEITFLSAINDGEKTGDWPIAHLSAKAAVLTGGFDAGGGLAMDDDRVVNQDGARGCFTAEGDRDWFKWRSLFLDGDRPRFPDAAALWKAVDDAPGFLAKLLKLQQALNRLYLDRFGDACSDVTTDRTITITMSVTIQLTRQCLMRQIARVVTNPWLGAWKIVNGQRVPGLPGTSAGKLPCASDWALINRGLAPEDWTWPWDTIEGVEGDADMGVIEYTRLTHLLYRARTANSDLRSDADAALTKLNQWVLTLRGEPARETYNVFWSCGNFDNSFGTANDYLDDNDVYNQELGKSVSGDDEGGRSFWDDVWKFLRFLAAAAAVGLIVGAALGFLFGAGLGGAALTGALVGLAVAGGLITVATVFDLAIEETENHLLMQNSSKYLKNKLMMAELRTGNDKDGFDDIVDENEEVREWLLERLQRIAEEDFLEYNAKPYNGFSLRSILNLVDYACDISWSWEQASDPPRGERACDPRDVAVVTAASAVYDLSAAKVALGSNQGRRLIPFRRLVEENLRYRDTWQTDDNGTINTHDPKRFLDVGGGADHLVGALQLWAGTTHHGPNGHASGSSVGEMLWYATSVYRPHEMILDIAVNKSAPYEQSLNHYTYERYSSGPGWLLTAGGDSEAQAQGLRISVFGLGPLSFTIKLGAPANDKGVGVPTTLMTAGAAARRDTYKEFLRFEGTKEDWGKDGLSILQSFSDNACVTGTFACGLRFEIPDAVGSCLRTAPPPAPAALRFITSAECAEYRDGDASTADDLFLAVWRSACASGQDDCDDRPWGFIEVARPDAFGGSLTRYAQAVTAANRGNIAAWQRGEVDEEMKFWSVTQNREIRFTPDDEDFDEDCRACGSIVRHESGARFTINHPSRPGRIFIDLNEEKSPIRRGEGGVVLAAP